MGQPFSLVIVLVSMIIFLNFLFWFYVLLISVSKCSESYDEALEAEKFYSKHRNSDDFREEQAKKQLRREHPVNYNQSNNSDLIDANNIMSKINAGDSRNFTNCPILYYFENLL